MGGGRWDQGLDPQSRVAIWEGEDVELYIAAFIAAGRASIAAGRASIAAVAGHSLSSVTTILGHYLPRDDQVARNAQTKRGLKRQTA
jgi:hypothetical protein